MNKNRYYYIKMTAKILVKVSLLFCMNNALFLVLLPGFISFRKIE